MKIGNSQKAYYTEDGVHFQLIDTNDAKSRLEDGITLRGKLFDVDAYKMGEIVPAKFVMPKNSKAYFSSKAVKLNSKDKKNEMCSYEDFITFAKDVYYMRLNKTYDFGVFKFTKSAIVDIDGYSRDEKYNLGVAEIDVLLKTEFMDFAILFTITKDISKDNITAIKMAYNMRRNSDITNTDSTLPNLLEVINVDLREQYQKAKLFGLSKELKKEIQEKCSKGVKRIPLIDMYKKETAPFGYSSRTKLPFNLVVNTYADGLSKNVKNVIKKSSCVNIINDDRDGLTALYLQDDSSEHPMTPLMCPIHNEQPLRLIAQSKHDESYGNVNRGNLFVKCSEYRGNRDIIDSECSVVVSFCNKDGEFVDEYLIVGDFRRLKNKGVLRKLWRSREAYKEYKKEVAK